MEEIPNQNIDMGDNNNNYGSKSNEIPNNDNNNQNNNKLKGFFNKIKNVNKLLKNNNSNSTEETKEVDISNSNDIKNPENNPPTWKTKLENKLVNLIQVEKNYAVFLVLICLGFFLIFISFLLLPLIITSPAKFSLCFALGSFLILISFLFLNGTKIFFKKIFSSNRIWISFCFIFSIFIGIGFALGKHYFISLLCSLFQLISLILFILSFIPGGKCGINAIKNLIKSPFSGIWLRMAGNQINN